MLLVLLTIMMLMMISRQVMPEHHPREYFLVE
jgi:hypothetical protein